MGDEFYNGLQKKRACMLVEIKDTVFFFCSLMLCFLFKVFSMVVRPMLKSFSYVCFEFFWCEATVKAAF